LVCLRRPEPDAAAARRLCRGPLLPVPAAARVPWQRLRGLDPRYQVQAVLERTHEAEGAADAAAGARRQQRCGLSSCSGSRRRPRRRCHAREGYRQQRRGRSPHSVSQWDELPRRRGRGGGGRGGSWVERPRSVAAGCGPTCRRSPLPRQCGFQQRSQRRRQIWGVRSQRSGRRQQRPSGWPGRHRGWQGGPRGCR
jgi:hypothetical protein